MLGQNGGMVGNPIGSPTTTTRPIATSFDYDAIPDTSLAQGVGEKTVDNRRMNHGRHGGMNGTGGGSLFAPSKTHLKCSHVKRRFIMTSISVF